VAQCIGPGFKLQYHKKKKGSSRGVGRTKEGRVEGGVKLVELGSKGIGVEWKVGGCPILSPPGGRACLERSG
jgi:hypothetical protein